MADKQELDRDRATGLRNPQLRGHEDCQTGGYRAPGEGAGGEHCEEEAGAEPVLFHATIPKLFLLGLITL